MFCCFCGTPREEGLFCSKCGKCAQSTSIPSKSPDNVSKPQKERPRCSICHQIKVGHGAKCQNIPCEGMEFCGVSRLHTSRGKHKSSNSVSTAIIPVSTTSKELVSTNSTNVPVKFQANRIYSTETTEEIKAKVQAENLKKQIEVERNRELIEDLANWMGTKDPFFNSDGRDYAIKLAGKTVQIMLSTLKGAKNNKKTIDPELIELPKSAPILLENQISHKRKNPEDDLQITYTVQHPREPLSTIKQENKQIQPLQIQQIPPFRRTKSCT